MKSPELWQVVVPPSDRIDLDEVNRVAANERPMQISNWTLIKLYLADVLHPLGVHHWVQYRTFDRFSRRIIQWPNYWICSKCPRAKIE